MKVPVKILFIRRDNIGDLICTTPTIRAVRQRYPDARIDILVNSYNAEAIRTNPDINEVHIYRKGKHFPEESPLEVFWSNLKVIWRLRRQHYDYAIACGSFTPTLQRFTRMCAAARSVGFVSAETGRASYTDPIPLPPAGEHEVDRVFRLLLPLGVSGDPGPLLLFPDPAE
ncbi:MAG TPA: glycosyltransferase family 9 protein, partial [Geobacteraceae bacterium]